MALDAIAARGIPAQQVSLATVVTAIISQGLSRFRSVSQASAGRPAPPRSTPGPMQHCDAEPLEADDHIPVSAGDINGAGIGELVKQRPSLRSCVLRLSALSARLFTDPAPSGQSPRCAVTPADQDHCGGCPPRTTETPASHPGACRHGSGCRWPSLPGSTGGCRPLRPAAGSGSSAPWR